MLAVREKQQTYEPRRPQDSLLFKVVNDNWAGFIESLDLEPESKGLPNFVVREFEKFLACGFYETGMTRIGCKDSHCGEDYWIPTSCKGRGFCPSCGGRRMNSFAINLDERVLPNVPVRQYVVTVPIPMRYWMLANHELSLAVNRIIMRAVQALLRRKARRQGVDDGVIGAVTFLQRFGAALNAHPHYHILVLDGVFESPQNDKDVPGFLEAPALTDDDVASMAKRICRNTTKYLVKEGYLQELSSEPDYAREDSLVDDSPALAACKKASIVDRIAFGVRAGEKVRRIGARQFGYGEGAAETTGHLCAKYRGFTVHASTLVAENNRDRLRELICYVARPAVSLSRMSLTKEGDIRIDLKSQWPDGTTALILSPQETIEKLAALVPYPQKNLVIYSGCLAPNHSIRSRIVPDELSNEEPRQRDDKKLPVVGTANNSPPQPPAEPADKKADVADAAGQQNTEQAKAVKPRHYISWAELLKKTWGIDVFSCRGCGGPTRVKAFVSDSTEIQKIMKHFGLASRPPPANTSSFEVVYEPDV